MSKIIKGYNKKVAPKPRDQTLKSDCRKKQKSNGGKLLN